MNNLVFISLLLFILCIGASIVSANHNNVGDNKSSSRHVSYRTANDTQHGSFRELGNHESISIDTIRDENLADYMCGLRYSRDERDRREQQVPNGNSMKRHHYPSYLRLQVTNDQGSKFFFGATLINRQYALTAAQWFLGGKAAKHLPGALLTPTIHGNQRTSDRSFKVAKHCPLPKSSGSVTLLKLAHPITYSRTLMPACLTETNLMPTDPIAIVGFGGYKEAAASATLIQALPVAKEECSIQNSTEPSLCFKPSGVNHHREACIGDSGGPVFANFNGVQTLVGIVTKSNNRCPAQHQGSGTVQAADVYVMKREILNAMSRC